MDSRAPLAMAVFADCGIDVLLAGHLHASHDGNAGARYLDMDHAALVVQTGTATSKRVHDEENSFNVIGIEPARIIVRRRA